MGNFRVAGWGQPWGAAFVDEFFRVGYLKKMSSGGRDRTEDACLTSLCLRRIASRHGP
jgi:hypothetical protein